MRFRVASEVFERFPEACVAVVAATDVANSAPVEAVRALPRAAEQEARERLNSDDLKAHPFIARWREAFRALDLNPNKYRSSVEALLARVLKGDELPALSPAVDLVNAVSLRYMLPVGAHDADRLSGDLQVRRAMGGEMFHPIGGGEAEMVEPGEIVYADDAEVRTRRWVWRQGDGARVTAESRTILFPIDGWLGLNETDAREAARELARLLQEHLGARTALAFVDREHPEVVVFEEEPSPPAAGQPSPPTPLPAAGEGSRTPPRPADMGEGSSGTTVGEGSSGTTVGEGSGGGGNGGPVVRVAEREPDRIDEALTRGVVDVIVRENLERRLRAGDRLRVKLGVDPTGPRLHIGRAVPLRILRRFQELGHTVCLVIGDFTAQIGDASDKDAARRVLSEREVYQNMATYKEQMGRILDESRVEWTYNSDWLGQLRFKDVVQLAQLFTVAQMLERENFSLRYAEGKPIGLHEFMYPLMQGFDSYALNADLELGGTDQLFNLMAGRIVQQRGFAKRPQDIMTNKMIWGLDGRKMSTSEGNTILIDEPPVDMYGKVMSMGDDYLVDYFETCTDVPLREVREIERELTGGLNPIMAKKRLAYEITRLYHGDTGALEGQRYFEDLHQHKGALADEDWPEKELADATPRQVGQLFKDAGLVTSTSDARRTIESGGLELDGQRVTDFAAVVTPYSGMKLRRGKNRLARLRVAS